MWTGRMNKKTPEERYKIADTLAQLLIVIIKKDLIERDKIQEMVRELFLIRYEGKDEA